MMKIFLFLLFSIFVHSSTVFSQEAELLNKDIVNLIKAGVGPEIVIAKIKSSSNKFDVTSAGLIELKTAGVPDAVIVTMLESSKSRSEPGKMAGTAGKKLYTVEELQKKISNHYDTKYFSIRFDRFKDLTFLTVQIELPSNYSLGTVSENFSWHLNTTFEGNGIYEMPKGRSLCATSSSRTWRFLKNRNLNVLAGANRIALGGGTHDGEVIEYGSGVVGRIGVAEKLCWLLDNEQFEVLTNAPTIEFQLGGYESRIDEDRLRLISSYTAMMSLAKQGSNHSDVTKPISIAKGKRKVFVETSDSECRKAIVKKLLSKRFQIVTEPQSAELILQFGVEKSDFEQEIIGLVEKKWGKIYVFSLQEKELNLIFTKVKEPPVFGWALANQARNLTEDFIKELFDVEKSNASRTENSV